MNNILIFKDGSDLDNILCALWVSNHFQPIWFKDFVKSLDDNITHVKHDEKVVTITFKDEISKMFFILKYE